MRPKDQEKLSNHGGFHYIASPLVMWSWTGHWSETRHTWPVFPCSLQFRDNNNWTEANLTEFETVWFDDRWFTNILALSKVKYKLRVMYDSAEGNYIIMVIPNNDVLLNEKKMGSTTMIWKIVIRYLSTVWKKTKSGYHPEKFMGSGMSGRSFTCLATHCRKRLSTYVKLTLLYSFCVGYTPTRL